jgi:hypothetical protein
MLIWLWKLVRDYNRSRLLPEEHMPRVEAGLDRIATLLERNHPEEAGPKGKDRNPDEALDPLHRAGWSVGEVRCGSTWLASEQNGENLIRADGRSQAEAWQQACHQAELVGMLAPERTEKWTR